jgi:hypothetical protein
MYAVSLDFIAWQGLPDADLALRDTTMRGKFEYIMHRMYFCAVLQRKTTMSRIFAAIWCPV